jgi:hypothetical protein
VRQQAAELTELGNRLEALANTLDAVDEVSPDVFLETIEVMTMIEKYYTPEQLKQLEERRTQGGPEMEAAIQNAPQMWANLHADVKAAMDSGVDPAAPEAKALAERWLALVMSFTGGDPGIFASLKAMYQNEDNVRGMDVKAMRPMNEYLDTVRAAHGVKHPGE